MGTTGNQSWGCRIHKVETKQRCLERPHHPRESLCSSLSCLSSWQCSGPWASLNHIPFLKMVWINLSAPYNNNNKKTLTKSDFSSAADGVFPGGRLVPPINRFLASAPADVPRPPSRARVPHPFGNLSRGTRAYKHLKGWWKCLRSEKKILLDAKYEKNVKSKLINVCLQLVQWSLRLFCIS